jgi:hypothetical protein
MTISKDTILYLAKREWEKAKEKYEKEHSWKNCWNALNASKRLDDAILYYEGNLKFKGEK